VTAEATSSQQTVQTRPRPRLHFTADDGWINDPYGIAWVGDRYHLYYQAIPGRVTWAPNCHWGHAESVDLAHWTERPLALVPQDFEIGCWSGTVTTDTDPPILFYTRVSAADPEIGQVAVATWDNGTAKWRTGAADVVVHGPPPQLKLRSFRDPNVFRTEQGWAMLMAAALPNGSGAVLQYSSTDLRQWRYDGVLCTRPNDPADVVPTGALWECPQLFRLGKQWVLMVSVWDQHDLLYVAAAVGSYNGSTFQPERWQRVTHGACAYAMSAFTDRDGRPCVLSWLREEPRNNDALSQRAGAHSVVSTLSLDHDGTLVLRPHPDVDARRGPALTGRGGRYDAGTDAVELSMMVSDGIWCEIVENGRTRARLSYNAAERVVTIDRPDLAPGRLPLPTADVPFRLLLDADIVEIFTAVTYGAYRIAPAANPSATTLMLSGYGAATATVRPFTGA
jgi:beta-fructofuranosidase